MGEGGGGGGGRYLDFELDGAGRRRRGAFFVDDRRVIPEAEAGVQGTAGEAFGVTGEAREPPALDVVVPDLLPVHVQLLQGLEDGRHYLPGMGTRLHRDGPCQPVNG